jgi:hypothetical protein
MLGALSQGLKAGCGYIQLYSTLLLGTLAIFNTAAWDFDNDYRLAEVKHDASEYLTEGCVFLSKLRVTEQTDAMLEEY